MGIHFSKNKSDNFYKKKRKSLAFIIRKFLFSVIVIDYLVRESFKKEKKFSKILKMNKRTMTRKKTKSKRISDLLKLYKNWVEGIY